MYRVTHGVPYISEFYFVYAYAIKRNSGLKLLREMGGKMCCKWILFTLLSTLLIHNINGQSECHTPQCRGKARGLYPVQSS